jgi:reticulon-4-interacting protein 1, mitochondrial
MVTNATGTTLVCLGPSSGFEVRQVLRRKPAAGEIEVSVAAASVNPIDVRRAQGRRLPSLVGAGRFPILGNDFAGTVTVLGDNVDAFKIGDRVYGVKPPSTEGRAVESRHMKVELVSAQRRHVRRAACSAEGRSLS